MAEASNWESVNRQRMPPAFLFVYGSPLVRAGLRLMLGGAPDIKNEG